MSDGIKWTLLATTLIVLVGLIVALPLGSGINIVELGSAMGTIVSYCGTALRTVRGILNNLLTPVGRTILTGLLYYILFKFVFVIGINVTTWIYKWIFK